MASSGPELSIIVPTLNERGNVEPLVAELSAVLGDLSWEVIFVDDDSPDDTAARVRELAARDRRVRCLQRVGRRGLSSGCIEGMLASSAPCLAVMDGDLQHDPHALVRMFDLLRSGDVEIVVGSRYAAGGGTGDWSARRLAVSRAATWLGRSVVPAGLSDPMSGFFMLRRSLLEDVLRNLSALGFKLLLDIFASARRPLRFAEVPYVFRERQVGQSKLDSQVAWEYVMLLADKLVGRYVPVRFLAFALIGGLGVGVHLAVLAVAYRLAGSEFVSAQAVATVTAMVFNYSLNNALTYRDRRRRGLAWLTGLGSFMVVCSVGALGNIGIAAYLFYRETGWLLSAVAGILVGAVWNYAVTGLYTWGVGRRS
jgi:dolichol-phosphate mannosyltransferase